jgi:transcription elongation factor Elf1
MSYGSMGSKEVLRVYPGFGECPNCGKTTMVTREVKEGRSTKVEVYCSNCSHSKTIG